MYLEQTSVLDLIFTAKPVLGRLGGLVFTEAPVPTVSRANGWLPPGKPIVYASIHEAAHTLAAHSAHSSQSCNRACFST